MADLFISKQDMFALEVNHLTAQNASAVALWCGGVEVVEHDALDYGQTYAGINVPTEVGMVRAQEGDWIVKRSIGDFVVFTNAAFEHLFEPVK